MNKKVIEYLLSEKEEINLNKNNTIKNLIYSHLKYSNMLLFYKIFICCFDIKKRKNVLFQFYLEKFLEKELDIIKILRRLINIEKKINYPNYEEIPRDINTKRVIEIPIKLKCSEMEDHAKLTQ